MIASCSKRQQASADKQARVVAFNSTEAIGAEAWWTVSSTRQGPRVESHGNTTASLAAQVPSLALGAHAVAHSSFPPVVCIACHARAHPRSRPDGHRADQRCAHATLRGRLRAARSVHAEQSLLPLLAISAPSHMLLSVLLPGRPCATVCHATQGLPVLDERALQRAHQL